MAAIKKMALCVSCKIITRFYWKAEIQSYQCDRCGNLE